ncbi:MAG TPA: hypothetical protein VJB59_04085 [Bdellovibrionota bacterium]|nr:hypothetical protein [Bdellovibrionota bacterium]
MKYLVAVMFVALATTAFANTPDNNHNGNALEFNCLFESPATGKLPAVTCQARGILCEESDVQNVNRCREDEKILMVRCSDGYVLVDRDAKVHATMDDLAIIGKEKGDRSIVTIRDLERNHQHRFGAELVNILRNGDTFRLFGECKVEKKEENHPTP